MKKAGGDEKNPLENHGLPVPKQRNNHFPNHQDNSESINPGGWAPMAPGVQCSGRREKKITGIGPPRIKNKVLRHSSSRRRSFFFKFKKPTSVLKNKSHHRRGGGQFRDQSCWGLQTRRTECLTFLVPAQVPKKLKSPAEEIGAGGEELASVGVGHGEPGIGGMKLPA